MENTNSNSNSKGDKPASRTGRYLKYAIGEIFLVVIGILIALQINTWNENRKERNLELELLKNLSDDLEYNILRIEDVYSTEASLAAQNRRLLELLKDENSVYDDSLQIYFGQISRYDLFSPRKMAYEGLKSKGLGIIKNDSIRSSIILLYDETYLFNAHMVELKKDIHINSLELFNRSLLTLDNVQLKEPVDFEALKSDTEFINTLSYITGEDDNFIGHYRNILSKTKSVEENILREIKRLEN